MIKPAPESLHLEKCKFDLIRRLGVENNRQSSSESSDYEVDFSTGYQNVSYHHQQYSSELQSREKSAFIKDYYH